VENAGRQPRRAGAAHGDEPPAPSVGRTAALYTAMRVGLFVVVLLLLMAVGLPSFPALLLALLISLVGSVFVLRRQREELARALEGRAQRSQARRRHEQEVRDHVEAQRRAGGAQPPPQ
jgi:flagellar biosynthesis component FlhA